MSLSIEKKGGVIQAPSQFPSLAREWNIVRSAQVAEYETLKDEEAYSPTPVPSTIELFLKYADGTCGDWADFFIEVLAVQGIAANNKGINAVAQAGTPAGANALFMVPQNKDAQGTDAPKEHRWVNHAVVEYLGEIYDPSYGITYGEYGDEALKQFLEKSIVSIGYTRLPLPGEDTQGYGRVYEGLVTQFNLANPQLYVQWEVEEENPL